MNKFELFSLIYLALDADWDETHDEELGQYLSDANPFLFSENVSAVQDVFIKFGEFIGDRQISKENSFALATDYIKQLDIPAVTKSFSGLGKEQWDAGVDEYLSSPHKGQ